MENQTEIIKQCLQGDNKALEQLIKNVQGQIYNLSVRFLWNPMDAEDATQEILIKIITNLATFKGQSAFETWAYRLASNYLINTKRNQTEEITFEIGEYHLKEGLNHNDYNGADKELLAEEVKIGCTTSILSCLTRPMRLAYILGEIFEYDSIQASYILDIEPEAFRKRLSIARKSVRDFMSRNCGIYHEKNSCRCTKQINYDLDIKRINPKQLLFADKGTVQKTVSELENIGKDIAIFQSHPNYSIPNKILDNIKGLFKSGEYPILTDK
ncbi:MAG: RNA polymerase sigma factor [Cyclobacteriaceae bacterium]